jgi:hypothetical protein
LLTIIVIGAFINTKEKEEKNEEIEQNYIRVETDKNIYKYGEKVSISVILVNNRNSDIIYYSIGGDRRVDVIIYSLNNSIIWDNIQVVQADEMDKIIVPGNSEYILEDITWSQTNSTDHQVSWGNYRIFARNDHSPIIEGNKNISILNPIEIYSNKQTYNVSENISIFMTNVGNVLLIHNFGWGGYIVKDSSGSVIYNQNIVIFILSSLWPEETVSVGTWYQNDNNGNQVSTGSYIIEKTYAGFTNSTEIIIQ